DYPAPDTHQRRAGGVRSRPDLPRKMDGTEFLRRCEQSLRDHGSTTILPGSRRPNKPFYTGVYGGSNSAGFLLSDPDAEPFFRANGYEPDRRVLVFDRRLDTPLNIVDSRFGALRKKYEPQALPPARLGSWWRGSCLGSLDAFE